MTVVNEKLIDEAHRLARWIGFDQFKIKLPIQDSDWFYQHYDAADHPSLDECVEKTLDLLYRQYDAKGHPIDRSSVVVHKDTYPNYGGTSKTHSVRVQWKYTTSKPRECTFTTIAAVEVPHDDDEPNLRTYRILGCSRELLIAPRAPHVGSRRRQRFSQTKNQSFPTGSSCALLSSTSKFGSISKSRPMCNGGQMVER